MIIGTHVLRELIVRHREPIAHNQDRHTLQKQLQEEINDLLSDKGALTTSEAPVVMSVPVIQVEETQNEPGTYQLKLRPPTPHRAWYISQSRGNSSAIFSWLKRRSHMLSSSVFPMFMMTTFPPLFLVALGILAAG